MNTKLESLSTEQLSYLLSQERRKFLLGLDFGASGSDLEEIREYIKRLESILQSRELQHSNLQSKPDSRSSVA